MFESSLKNMLKVFNMNSKTVFPLARATHFITDKIKKKFALSFASVFRGTLFIQNNKTNS